VLLPGYDFTRNQPGGSEMRDVPPFPYSGHGQPARVNQSTAAVLDQSTAAVLDNQCSVCGIWTWHDGRLGSSTLWPARAHHASQSVPFRRHRLRSDILRAIYYAVQNKAKVINMSFDFTTYSKEFGTLDELCNRAGGDLRRFGGQRR